MGQEVFVFKKDSNIAHKPDFRPWFRLMFGRGYLGLLWALIRLDLLNRNNRPKVMVPTDMRTGLLSLANFVDVVIWMVYAVLKFSKFALLSI